MSLSADETDEVCHLLDQKLSAQAIAQRLILPLPEVMVILDARRHRAVTTVDRAYASKDPELVEAARAFEAARERLHELLDRHEHAQQARSRVARAEAELAAARQALDGPTPPLRLVGLPSSVPPAVIREWARKACLDPPSRGSLPARIVQAYLDAHPDAPQVAG